MAAAALLQVVRCRLLLLFPLLLLLLLLPAAVVHGAIQFTVLSPGTPQASLEVLFEGSGGGKEEVLHADLRALVSRSGSITLSAPSQNNEGWRPGQQPPPSSSSSSSSSSPLARLSTQRKGHALLAPEQPGDVVVLDLSSSLPTSTSSALVVVRGATVLAREGGVQVGPVNDKELVRALLSVSSKDTAPTGGGGGGGGQAPPPLQRYSGNGKLALTAYGSIIRTSLPAGEERVVKAGHVLAWTEPTAVKFGPSSQGGHSYTLRGPGVIYLRSHSPAGFRKWAAAAGAIVQSATQLPSKGGKGEERGGAKEEAAAVDLLAREGLGKRLKRRIRSVFTAALSAFLFVAAMQVAQALLMEGPEGLKTVPHNLLLLLQGIQTGAVKAAEWLVDAYQSDVWEKVGGVLSTAVASVKGGGGGHGGGGKRCETGAKRQERKWEEGGWEDLAVEVPETLGEMGGL